MGSGVELAGSPREGMVAPVWRSRYYASPIVLRSISAHGRPQFRREAVILLLMIEKAHAKNPRPLQKPNRCRTSSLLTFFILLAVAHRLHITCHSSWARLTLDFPCHVSSLTTRFARNTVSPQKEPRTPACSTTMRWADTRQTGLNFVFSQVFRSTYLCSSISWSKNRDCIPTAWANFSHAYLVYARMCADLCPTRAVLLRHFIVELWQAWIFRGLQP